MPSRIGDRFLRHQHYLLRYGAHVGNEVSRLIAQAHLDVRRMLRARLEEVRPGRVGNWTTKRLEGLQKRLAQIAAGGWDDADEYLRETNRELVGREVAWTVDTLGTSLQLDVVSPNARQVYTAARDRPVDGRTLRDLWQGLKVRDITLMNNVVSQGVIEGKTTEQIARDVGDRQLVSERHARSTSHTGIQQMAAAAHEETYSENSDLIVEVQYVATLDERTTPICRSLDGKRFPIDEGPRPPQHINCRSTTVPVLEGQTDLGRPTYDEWLRRQPAAFQDEILGNERGALFRRGGLTVESFMKGQSRKMYTLEEMRELDKFDAAYEQANIDKSAA